MKSFQSIGFSKRNRFLALVLLCFVGCGEPPTGTVTGRVVFDGQPIPMGTIQFVNDKGTVANGSIRDGEYRVERVPVGATTIVVTAVESINTASNPPPVMRS